MTLRNDISRILLGEIRALEPADALDAADAVISVAQDDLRDAARYRWLRDKCDTTTGFLLSQRLERDEWDAIIDKEISDGERGTN